MPARPPPGDQRFRRSSRYDWLVCTVAGALVLGVPLDPEPLVAAGAEPELPDAPELEPLVPEELVVVVELGLDELLVGVPVVPVLLVVVTAATAVLRDSAGSLPDASWMTITDHEATKTVATIATTRRRILDARHLRARRRAATTRFASCAVAAGVRRSGEEESGEELGEVMVYLSC